MQSRGTPSKHAYPPDEEFSQSASQVSSTTRMTDQSGANGHKHQSARHRDSGWWHNGTGLTNHEGYAPDIVTIVRVSYIE